MHLISSLLIAILFCFSAPSSASPVEWQTLAPGLEYTRVNSLSSFALGYIHAFRFDLQHYQLQLAFTKDDKNNIASIPDLVNSHHAIIGVNGGFFNPDLKPLGLRISHGEIINPLKQTAWWGIFFIRDNKAYIVPQNNYQPDKKIEFAVQSGPRLLTQGKIHDLKPGMANRSALCITQDGHVILLATENLPVSTSELANIMRLPRTQGGMDCVDALNLDGGSSTQLYAQIKGFLLNTAGFSAVSDAILVLPKTDRI